MQVPALPSTGFPVLSVSMLATPQEKPTRSGCSGEPPSYTLKPRRAPMESATSGSARVMIAVNVAVRSPVTRQSTVASEVTVRFNAATWCETFTVPRASVGSPCASSGRGG